MTAILWRAGGCAALIAGLLITPVVLLAVLTACGNDLLALLAAVAAGIPLWLAGAAMAARGNAC